MSVSLRAILEAGGNNKLATDDDGAVLTYNSQLADIEAASFPFEPGKGLVLLQFGDRIASLQLLLTLLARNHAVILAAPEAPPSVIETFQNTFQPDAVANPDQGSWRACDASGRPELHPDLSVMLSTSGSTGSPKLARFTLDALLSNGEAIATYLDLRADDVAFAHLPLHYSYGFSLLTSHLMRGASIALTGRSVMQKEFWTRWSESGATSFPGVPTHYQLLLRLGLKRLTSTHLRALTQAGGRLAPELVKQAADFAAAAGVKFYPMYGQTEAGPRIAYLPPDLAASRPEAIGRPIPGAEIWLRGEDGSLAANGAEGELICRSPGIMMGYAQNAADLALGDVQRGELATGDLAICAADGLFQITGRRSRFLKLMGNRVSLDHVEEMLAGEGAVTAIGRDDWLCVVTEDPARDLQKMSKALVDRMSVPPRAIEARHVHTIPRSPAGKVLYGRLLAQISGD